MWCHYFALNFFYFTDKPQGRKFRFSLADQICLLIFANDIYKLQMHKSEHTIHANESRFVKKAISRW